MLSLHPDAAWLHIGCDEVYQLGQCPICSQKLLTANTDPSNSNGYQDGRSLFLQHVHRVASYVKNQKNVIPIIWDDMLRTIPAHILQVGTIHLRRRQIFTTFDPYPPPVGKFAQFLTPSPPKNADVLNGRFRMYLTLISKVE